MATLKKCDRCGVVKEHTASRLERHDEWGLSARQRGKLRLSQDNSEGVDRVDLCVECTRDLKRWFDTDPDRGEKGE